MNISQLIESRKAQWQQLEDDIEWIRGRSSRRVDPAKLAEFARCYRAVCSDLSLSISMGFPDETIRYLHQLVADGHAMLYRSESFRIRDWGKVLCMDTPNRILRDPCTWIAMAIFWGLFFGSFLGAMVIEDFSTQVVGEATLANMEMMYSSPIGEHSSINSRSTMTGFYVFNNAGIGLRCFAFGIFLGVGSLVVLAFNAIFLGSIFGHMISSPHADHFINFVTAHGPFELTAVALSAAAGLKLGWSIIDTKGWSRGDSLRRTASQAIEIALVATILFFLAAIIEGNISPLQIPYSIKLSVAIVSCLMMALWLLLPSLLGSSEPSGQSSLSQTTSAKESFRGSAER